MSRRSTSSVARANMQKRNLGLHGRLSARGGRVAEGASGNDPLGLRRPVAPGRRHSHEKARVVRTAMSSLPAVSLRELISHSTLSPSLPDPMSRKRSSSGSSTTRLLPSMSATLTRHRRRPLRSWFTATGLPTKGFGRSLRVWRPKANPSQGPPCTASRRAVRLRKKDRTEASGVREWLSGVQHRQCRIATPNSWRS